jgi:hypothetical protein
LEEIFQSPERVILYNFDYKTLNKVYKKKGIIGERKIDLITYHDKYEFFPEDRVNPELFSEPSKKFLKALDSLGIPREDFLDCVLDEVNPSSIIDALFNVRYHHIRLDFDPDYAYTNILLECIYEDTISVEGFEPEVIPDKNWVAFSIPIKSRHSTSYEVHLNVPFDDFYVLPVLELVNEFLNKKTNKKIIMTALLE